MNRGFVLFLGVLAGCAPWPEDDCNLNRQTALSRIDHAIALARQDLARGYRVERFVEPVEVYVPCESSKVGSCIGLETQEVERLEPMSKAQAEQRLAQFIEARRRLQAVECPVSE